MRDDRGMDDGASQDLGWVEKRCRVAEPNGVALSPGGGERRLGDGKGEDRRNHPGRKRWRRIHHVPAGCSDIDT